MNDVLKYLISSINSKTLSLKKKGILIEKPWALIDTNGEIQKLIFKRDHGLILSINGKVTEGHWEYYPEAKALLIDRGKDKLLLQEQFIDENVLILKKDGTDNDFFTLANENTLPDYDVPKYLYSLKCKEFNIAEFPLLNGNSLQVLEAKNLKQTYEFENKPAEQVGRNYKILNIPDGSYMTKGKKLTFYVKDGIVTKLQTNKITEFNNGELFEVEDASNYRFKNINKKITLNGEPLADTRLIDKDNYIFEVKQSRIAKILIQYEYELKNGYRIKIEQKNDEKISNGDKIIESSPIFPLPNGSYKIKGKWKKIKVKNNTII